MPAITIEQLENASQDADDFAEFVNGEPGMVTPRLGAPYPNIRQIIADVDIDPSTALSTDVEHTWTAAQYFDPRIFVDQILVGRGLLTQVNTNVAIGREAFASASLTGDGNTGVGHQVGYNITTGAGNCFYGQLAGFKTTTGNNNSSYGYLTLYEGTTGAGANNAAFGAQALRKGAGSNSNSAFGTHALLNATGDRNSAFGQGAGENITTGTDNALLGQASGINITTGAANTYVGGEAGFFTTTGSYNVAIGSQALRANTTGLNNVAIGAGSLRSNTTGINNIAVGNSSLYYNTTGFNNTSEGFQALQENTTGKENSAFGNQALIHNTTGEYNTAHGERALDGNRDGDYNTGCGGETGYIQASGNFNTFVGGRAGRGAETLITVTGVSGDGSVVTFTFAAIGSAIITGTTFEVTNLGPYNGWYIVSGGTTTTITAAGTTSTAYIPTGSNHLNVKFDVSENTVVGFEALKTPLTGADGNTCIGIRAGDAITTGKRNIIIGRDADPDSPTANDQINIGSRYFHNRISLSSGFTISSTGAVSGLSSISFASTLFAEQAGAYNVLRSPTHTALFLGGTTDQTTYHDNNTHRFRAANGSTGHATLNATAFTLDSGRNLVISGGSIRAASYTVATLPSASTHGAGANIYVSNEVGGATMAFSDGTNWRRYADRAIVS